MIEFAKGKSVAKAWLGPWAFRSRLTFAALTKEVFFLTRDQQWDHKAWLDRGIIDSSRGIPAWLDRGIIDSLL
ncbi:hypothetical protein P7K49_027961, partial [Saguinus oedipus]